MCVVKTHTLTKWVTENFARIFALGAISGGGGIGSFDVHKNSLTDCFCGSPFTEGHTSLDAFTK
jgi:hypothetical protein